MTVRRQSVIVTTGLLAALALTACSGGSDPDAEAVLDVVVHDSFVMSDELKAAFEAETGLTVRFVSAGDGGALANKLVLSKDAPLGDVAFGVDNSFASRTTEEGVFVPYVSPVDAAPDLRLDDSGALTPVDYGDVCINVDTTWFTEQGQQPPVTLEDLVLPAYRDLTVVTNPATSTPGLAFLFATIGTFGEDGYLDYWQQLADNGLKVVDGWEDAYYTDFTASGEGDRPIVLSYASSPAYTVTEDGSATSTAALLGTCFRQVEYVGVLANGDNPDGARKFVDFLLGESFQSSIPEAMYVYPANPDAQIPADWATFAPVPTEPIALDPKEIAAKRDEWIKDWSAEVIG